MGIDSMINRLAVQTVVYWANPTPNGYDYDYDDPVEISVRWEKSTEIVINSQGEELVSRARIFPKQNLDEGGYIMLGGLTDLDSSAPDPKEVDGAWRIISFMKIPSLGSSDTFFRKANLT